MNLRESVVIRHSSVPEFPSTTGALRCLEKSSNSSKIRGIVKGNSFTLIIPGLFFKGSGASVNYGCN